MGLYPSDQDLYGCTECKTVICVECAIGKYPYLKSGITINVKGFEIETASNSSLSRPIWRAYSAPKTFRTALDMSCHNICRDKLVSSIREMLYFSVLSSVLYLHLKPYLPRQADSQKSSLFLYYYAWEKSVDGDDDKLEDGLKQGRANCNAIQPGQTCYRMILRDMRVLLAGNTNALILSIYQLPFFALEYSVIRDIVSN
ncbi:hypothetical protein YC2023_030140 [Brassica napus]